MNPIQKSAHSEGFSLVANAFNSGEKFKAELAVAWINRCIANDQSMESLALVDRDANSEIAAVRKLEATSAEMCGYRLAGIFTALETVRLGLQNTGVRVNLPLSESATCADDHQ